MGVGLTRWLLAIRAAAMWLAGIGISTNAFGWFCPAFIALRAAILLGLPLPQPALWGAFGGMDGIAGESDHRGRMSHRQPHRHKPQYQATALGRPQPKHQSDAVSALVRDARQSRHSAIGQHRTYNRACRRTNCGCCPACLAGSHWVAARISS
jgi:hypothetical protein